MVQRCMIIGMALLSCGTGATGAAAGGVMPRPQGEIAGIARTAPAVNWEGPYVGLGFGAAIGESRAERGDFFGDLIELDVSNGLFPESIEENGTDLQATVLGGYQVQRGGFVAGVELDLSVPGPDVEAEFSRIDPGPIFPDVNTITTYGTDIDAMSALKIRGGYSIGRTLFFATAGIAVGRVENAFSLTLPEIEYQSPDWSEKDTLFGRTFGIGVERKLSEPLSLRFELLHYDFEDVTIEASDDVAFPGNGIDYKFDNAGETVRFAVNYLF